VHLNSGRRRAVAALAAAATAAALFTVPAAQTAAAAPPPNPTDGQLSAAQRQKDSLAGLVGQLSAQQATLQTQLAQARNRQELAEQKYAYALQLLERAKQNAVQTKQDAAAAQGKVEAAQTRFVEYAQQSYMSGELPGMTGALLSADDPNVLLQQSALEQYQSDHQLGAIDDLRRAKVGKANADAAARKAVQDQTKATEAAEQAKNAAIAAVQATRAQQVQVQAALAANETKLDQAKTQLATLTGQRQKYIAWKKEQARIAAERRRQQELARQRAAARARQLAQQHHSSGGSHGGGWSSPPSPSGGSWSASRGQNAVNRAEQYLGWMYAWAGGNAGGPTRGVCAGDGAWNDCNVVGFDCSGLVMYAWGPYLSLDHYAATQYWQAGSYHPSFGNLRPGDLVFWSDGGQAAIHHVAIYIGGGQIIEAPESGVPVRIANLWEYGTPYGATRPLT
jgi:cell wall-associated NlpC family hydrolase